MEGLLVDLYIGGDFTVSSRIIVEEKKNFLCAIL